MKNIGIHDELSQLRHLHLWIDFQGKGLVGLAFDRNFNILKHFNNYEQHSLTSKKLEYMNIKMCI